MRVGVGLTLLLLAAGLTAVPALTDPVSGPAPPGLHLATPLGYLVLAPLFTLWDGASMLSMSRLRGLLIGLALLYLLWRSWRAFRPRRGHSLMRELRTLAVSLVLLLTFLITGAVWHRPMLALAGVAPGELVVDFHSHTNVSHDVQNTWMRGFDTEANRRWHQRAGFDAVFITDHNTVAGLKVPSRRPNQPVVSPGFEVNDLGFQSRADQINVHLMLGHKWTQPSRLIRNWRLNLATFRSYDFGGDRTWDGYFLTGLFELNNFSTGKWYLAYNPESWSDRRTRGGPLTLNPSGVEWDFQMDSDPNKRWVYGLALHGTNYRMDSDKTWSVKGALEWKAGARITLRVEPQLERSRTSAQYVDTFDDATATGTFGHRYVFADLDQTTVSASFRLNWIFTPRLSLEVYTQPLLSSGRYTGFKELARPRSYAFTSYPDPAPTADPDRIIVDPDGPAGPAASHEIDDPNFSLASLRGNAVLRWEYSPGSTLFLVWTQNRSDTESIGTFRTGPALDRLFGAAADNIFLVKLSYWWNP